MNDQYAGGQNQMSRDLFDLSQLSSGTWVVDPVLSYVGFSVKHLLVSTVKARFDKFYGKIIYDGNPIGTSLDAYVDVASLQTGDSPRDVYIKSNEFFDVAKWPQMSLRGAVTSQGKSGYLLDAELTIRDMTKDVTFEVTYDTMSTGDTIDARTFTKSTRSTSSKNEIDLERVMLHARATVSRKELALKFTPVLESGGVIVSDAVQLKLDVLAVFDHQ